MISFYHKIGAVYAIEEKKHNEKGYSRYNCFVDGALGICDDAGCFLCCQ